MGEIAYTREEKVIHREWVELRFDAADVLSHPLVFTEDPDDEDRESGGLTSNPTLIFDKDEIYVDEMWGIKDDRVFTSSWQSGLSGWSAEKGEYVRSYHMRETSLGQFIAAEFREESWLLDNLAKALGEQSK